MSRRVSLPAAEELFRGNQYAKSRGMETGVREMSVVPDRSPTAEPGSTGLRNADQLEDNKTVAAAAAAAAEEASARRSSRRVRHAEKMTVYVTADELLEIEHARLSLRRHQGLAVDRGRLVREALAIVLADLETNGDDSVLVQRLLEA